MSEDGPSGWAAGWAAFAACMLIIAGIMQALAGLTALFNDEFYVRLPNYTFEFDITTWGWIHLVIGMLVFASGFAIFQGNVLGRTVGVIAAGGTMIANFMWLPYYPVWSVIVIAMCAAVIWALTAHGRDLAEIE